MFKAMLNHLSVAPLRKGKAYDVCPTLEWLEERLTPAQATSNIWTDMNRTGLWKDDGNWLMGHAPQSDEIAVFDGFYSSDNCLWSGGTNPAGLNFVNNFGGTLTFNAAMEVGVSGMDMECGNISQPVDGATLTVDGLLTWVAGNINTSTQQNVVLVNGGGNITGNAARTAGSTLNVTSVANFQMTADLTFNNNAGITISGTGSWNWTGSGNLSTAGTGYIMNQGRFTASLGAGNTATCDLWVWNRNGSYLRIASGTLNFTSSRGFGGVSISQDIGTLIIDAGATLGVAGGVSVGDGYLETYGSSAATIVGDVTVAGGDIILCADNWVNACGRLNITGTLDMTGGTYDAKIDTTNNVCDVIATTGSITLANGAGLTVVNINIPLNQAGNPEVVRGRTYEVMITTVRGTSIDGNFGAGNMTLGFDDSTNGAWLPSRSSNNATGTWRYRLSS